MSDHSHSAKNEHGMLVKLHLRKSQNCYPHCEKTGAQMEHPDLTPAFYTYRKNLSVWTHCLGENTATLGIRRSRGKDRRFQKIHGYTAELQSTKLHSSFCFHSRSRNSFFCRKDGKHEANDPKNVVPTG